MRRWGPVLVLIGSLAGCAHADYGQLADSATTALAGSGPAAIPFMVILTGVGWDWWWQDAQQTCANPWETPF